MEIVACTNTAATPLGTIAIAETPLLNFLQSCDVPEDMYAGLCGERRSNASKVLATLANVASWLIEDGSPGCVVSVDVPEESNNKAQLRYGLLDALPTTTGSSDLLHANGAAAVGSPSKNIAKLKPTELLKQMIAVEASLAASQARQCVTRLLKNPDSDTIARFSSCSGPDSLTKLLRLLMSQKATGKAELIQLHAAVQGGLAAPDSTPLRKALCAEATMNALALLSQEPILPGRTKQAAISPFEITSWLCDLLIKAAHTFPTGLSSSLFAVAMKVPEQRSAALNCISTAMRHGMAPGDWTAPMQMITELHATANQNKQEDLAHLTDLLLSHARMVQAETPDLGSSRWIVRAPSSEVFIGSECLITVSSFHSYLSDRINRLHLHECHLTLGC